MKKIITYLVTLFLPTLVIAEPLISPDLNLPDAKYDVKVERSVMIKMADGTRLSTDIYLPVGIEEVLPTILIRLPYGKNRFFKPGRYVGAYVFASQGYAVVIQDMRGKYQSEGDYSLLHDQGQDATDTIDWITKQNWSNGKVGGYGCSALGSTQRDTALKQHPAFAAMIPQASYGAPTTGAQDLLNLYGWLRTRGPRYYLRPPTDAPDNFWADYGEFYDPSPTFPDVDNWKVINSLPVIDIMDKANTAPNDYKMFIQIPPSAIAQNNIPIPDQNMRIKAPNQAMEDKLNILSQTPGLYLNTWYDGGVGEDLKIFSLLREKNHTPQFAIIGPGTHCAGFFLGIDPYTEKTKVADREMGDARFNFWGLYMKWFDYWLKGEENAVTDMAPVQIFVMGKNQWRGENSWPLQGTRYTPYYLHAGNGQRTGILSPKKTKKAGYKSYIYDPTDPVITTGGQVCGDCLPKANNTGGAYEALINDGPIDQRILDDRQDILSFSTPPLEKGTEVTGMIKARIYVSSSALDTDFAVKLIDVYPDGRAYNIQEGHIRARYREGFAKTIFMEPEKVYPVDINLHVTSNYFKPGHQIRLDITSSNFPRYDRNMNTGGNNYDETDTVIAVNKIHFSKKHPSHVILPIIPENR